jgi:hypothetical protein
MGGEVQHFMSGTRLMYGLAIETALKGRIVERWPTRVRIDVKADGRGDLLEAEITQLGVSIANGHDLHALAAAAGALDRHAEPQLFSDPADFDQFESVLLELSDAVLWSVRYPVPRGSKTPSHNECAGERLMEGITCKALDALVPLAPA